MADVLQDQVAAQAEGRWSLPRVQRSRAMDAVQKERALLCGQSPPQAGDAAALGSHLTQSVGWCWGCSLAGGALTLHAVSPFRGKLSLDRLVQAFALLLSSAPCC